MHKLIVIFVVIDILFFSNGLDSYFPASQEQVQSINEVFEHYSAEIPEIMKGENIPGLAIAVVDDQGVLWAEAFGRTRAIGGRPVTLDTLFSIQSMSKSFTATGIMFAVQNGLVELDAPVAVYLPDFRVNSIFEDAPLEKITLRNLLSHTAGFTHEAPLGSNYTDAPSFEAHIASIQDTWLKFPTGTRYGYSNLGVDLAGYILQVRSGKPFTQYIRQTVYEPLGMKNSAFSTPDIYQVKDRATGHPYPPLMSPADYWILPSGGIYTSANDMARYLRFHINGGVLDGQRLLKEDLLATMYTPPNPAAQQEGYGLGVAVWERNGTRVISHGGGGFGFKSEIMFYPELKLGIVLLTNTSSHDIQFSLPQEILDAVIASQPELYQQRASRNHAALPSYESQTAPGVLEDNQHISIIQQHAILLDNAARQRALKNSGFYLQMSFGLPIDNMTLRDDTDHLSSSVSVLHEIQPNFYLDEQGEVYDFRGRNIHYRNIPLLKVDAWLLLRLILLLAGLGWLVRLAIHWLRGRQKPRPELARSHG